jgi:hypothetical protein
MWRGENVIKFNTKNADVARFYKLFLKGGNKKTRQEKI